MSNFGGEPGFGLPTSTQPESNSYSNEDFEKLDHPGDLLDPFSQQPAEAEQDQLDELPTSSSFTGEEAEEDRYGISEATPNLLNFGDDPVEEPQSTTPSAPEVGEFYSSGFEPVPQEPIPQCLESQFSAPVSSTTTSGYDGSGDHEREHSQPMSEPFTNLSTESKEWTGQTAEQTTTGGASPKSDKVEISSQSNMPDELSKLFVSSEHFKTVGAWLKNIDPRETGRRMEEEYREEEEDELPVIEETGTPTKLMEPVTSTLTPESDKPTCSLCPAVLLDLIYWRDVKKTGVVFGSMMFMLLSLAFFSVLSVVAYLSLAALTITLSFRVYKNVLQAVQKTGDQHPFKQYLDLDIDLPEDRVQKAVANVTRHVNNTSRELRRLFLVEDLIDSIKFGLLLWVLTYIGAWFNGMTIIILDVVTIFTLPKFYETYKTQIDSYLDVARTHINKVITQVKAKIPFPSKKAIKKE